MERIAGGASEEGTAKFRDAAVRSSRCDPQHYRPAPGGLSLASIGLGTYLGAPDGPTDLAVEQAVNVALSSGRTNVIDTAINYRYQRAERSVGRALARLIEAGSVGREEVFVATKNGYLAPDAESKVPLDRYVQSELVRPGVLKPADIVDGSHAMSVGFLRDQFERSRTNLGLETIDLLYLHNAADAQLPVVGRPEFTRRLRSAFELYEELRASGALVAYGLATWESLRSPRSAIGHVELEEIVALAREVGGERHGLRYVQFPFNLAMPEAAAARTQSVGGERTTLFEAARRLGIGCFTSVPLLQGQLAQDGPAAEGLTRAQSAIQFARSAPGTLGPLIGQKQAEHLAENLRVAELSAWSSERFGAVLGSS